MTVATRCAASASFFISKAIRHYSRPRTRRAPTTSRCWTRGRRTATCRRFESGCSLVSWRATYRELERRARSRRLSRPHSRASTSEDEKRDRGTLQRNDSILCRGGQAGGRRGASDGPCAVARDCATWKKKGEEKKEEKKKRRKKKKKKNKKKTKKNRRLAEPGGFARPCATFALALAARQRLDVCFVDARRGVSDSVTIDGGPERGRDSCRNDRSCTRLEQSQKSTELSQVEGGVESVALSSDVVDIVPPPTDAQLEAPSPQPRPRLYDETRGNARAR